MGLGGISIWQLLIILVIVVLLFGTKRLSSLGSDLGSAIRGFRKAMQNEDGKNSKPVEDKSSTEGETIDSEAKREETR